jgi:hypothetical protein
MSLPSLGTNTCMVTDAKSWTKKRNSALFVIGLLVLACLAAIYIFSVHDEPFHSSQWKSVKIGVGQGGMRTSPGDTRRLAMLNDLLKRQLHPGMKRTDVLQILGEPESGDGTGEHGPIDVYWLVERPTLPRLWELSLWLRFRKSDLVLWLEYSANDHRLLNIIVR